MSQRVKTSARGLVLLWSSSPENGHLQKNRTTDPGQATGKLYHLRLQAECTLFCKLQSWARNHAYW